jgi:hypothetical protein
MNATLAPKCRASARPVFALVSTTIIPRRRPRASGDACDQSFPGGRHAEHRKLGVDPACRSKVLRSCGGPPAVRASRGAGFAPKGHEQADTHAAISGAYRAGMFSRMIRRGSM